MAKIELEIGANVQDLLAGFEQMKKQMSEFDAKMKGTFEKMSKEGEDAAQSLSKAMTDSMTKSATSIDKTNNAIEEQNNLLIEEQRHLELFRAARDKATSVQTWELYNKQVKKSEQVISNLSRQLKQFKDITNMSLGEMRKYMRELRNISLVGMSPKQIAEVNGKIAELTDAMGDYRAMLGATGDKTAMVIESFQGLVGIAQGVTGTLTLFGVENEKLEKSMMALINLSMAMQTFHDMNEKGLLKSTAATIKETIATWANNNAKKAGTGIAKGFFKVIAANPMLALAAGVAAAAVGIWKLVEAMKVSKDTTQELYESQSDVFNSTFEIVGSLSRLQTAINNSTTGTLENANAIKEYNDIARAQKLVIIGVNDSIEDQNSKMQINQNLLISRAKIQAAINEQEKLYGDLLRIDMAIEDARANKVGRALISDYQRQRDEVQANINKLGNYITAEQNANKTREDIIHLQAENEKKRREIEEMSTKTTQNNTTVTKENTQAKRDLYEQINKVASIYAKEVESVQQSGDVQLRYFDELDAEHKRRAATAEEMYKAGIYSEAEYQQAITDLNAEFVLKREQLREKEVTDEVDKYAKIKEIGVRMAKEVYSLYMKSVDDQISKLNEYVNNRNQSIGELESLLAAEVQLNEQGYASNIQIYQQRIQKEQQLRDEAMAQKEKYEKRKQAIETVSQAIDMSSAIAAMLKDAGVKFGVLAPIIGGAMIAALLMLFKKSKTQAAQTARFAKGGKGILQGASHSAGGVNLGEIGEGEGGEAYYILNKKATAKNRSLMDAVFDAVNGNRINLPLDAIASGGGTMTVELKEQAEIKEILKHMKSQKATVYGNGFRDETFGNVRRRIWTN